jgi:RNA polymerase sigma factor (sigma-70 family)
MNQLSEKQLINGFLEHNNRILKKFYDDCFPMIEKMVINTGGIIEQAEDVFQEALLVLYDKLLSGQFELKCKLTTYIYAVSKKIWLQEKRKNSRKKIRISEEFDTVQEPDYSEEVDDRIKDIFKYHFEQLSKDCQNILKMHFNKINISEIQRVMGYESTHYTMDRKYRCKKSLIKRIINDPKFNSIKNEYSGKIRTDN